MSHNLPRRPEFSTGQARALNTPLQPSVVYRTPSPEDLDSIYEGQADGFSYSREGHPNAAVLASKIDAMEGADLIAGTGLMTGSGMAAVSATLLALLKEGDHILGGDQLYGRSLRLLTQELPRYGIATSLFDPTDIKSLEAAIRPKTRLILVETISNPTLRIADMAGIITLAKERGITIAVDNTFATPLGYQPLSAGADIVIHSVTKLLAGHSDSMLGYVACRAAAHRDAIDGVIQTHGFTASPYDCWMAERGIMSFALRFERAQENAAKLADHLAGLGAKRVIYPGRSDHPDHNRAGQVLGRNFGNMVSFEIEGGAEAANRFVRALPDVPFAPTLGDIGTTLSHPPSSSHRAVSAQDRCAIGISDGFFRVSVGIEDISTLCAEFSDAFAQLVK